MKANKTISTAIPAVLVSACGGSDSDANSGYMMRGEFSSMARCLEVIQQNTGQMLKPVTDKPEEVSGFTNDGRFFNRERKVTGTKGTYYEGTYEAGPND